MFAVNYLHRIALHANFQNIRNTDQPLKQNNSP